MIPRHRPKAIHTQYYGTYMPPPPLGKKLMLFWSRLQYQCLTCERVRLPAVLPFFFLGQVLLYPSQYTQLGPYNEASVSGFVVITLYTPTCPAVPSQNIHNSKGARLNVKQMAAVS